MAADHKRPQAINARSKRAFKPGIGPHTETQTVGLVLRELENRRPNRYHGCWSAGVRYPEFPRQKCDICLGHAPNWEWALEVKMVRFLGDNGKLNDNILMHLLSPYPAHRSALTDCEKLVQSRLGHKKGLLVYGFDHEGWPMDPAIEAFETLASTKVSLGPRMVAHFSGLIHPVHRKGRVFAWKLRNG